MGSNRILFFLLFSCFSWAQDTLTNDKVNVDFSGYMDGYYAYDFNNSKQLTKQPFFYNHNRHNEFNINIALFRGVITYENIYAKLSFQAGTYVDDNYSNERLKNINEAYFGVYLDTAKKHTIEMGIFSSYIGFESAITGTNLTLTRSILAENSPYFMTGLKYNYNLSKKWILSGLITNGWQRIAKPNNSIPPSFGTQIVYKPSETSLLNWSTFVGKENYNGAFGMRYFSNVFWDATWDSKWRTIIGFDFGMQKLTTLNESYAKWWSPVFITQYAINSNWKTAARLEYYQDKHNVIISNSNPFSTYGYSLNFDYLFNTKAKFRVEARYLDSKEPLFNNNATDNFSITTSLSFEFN